VDYIVASVNSAASLTLSTAYAGATQSGLNARGYKNYTVSSVASNTSLTLTTNYASAATSAV